MQLKTYTCIQLTLGVGFLVDAKHSTFVGVSAYM